MAKINDLIAGFKASLKDGLKPDSSADDIKRIDSLCSKLDEIESEANTTLKDKADITDMYIQAVKNQGSVEAPKEDNGEKTPRSLEEIAQEVVAKDNK